MSERLKECLAVAWLTVMGLVSAGALLYEFIFGWSAEDRWQLLRTGVFFGAVAVVVLLTVWSMEQIRRGDDRRKLEEFDVDARALSAEPEEGP